MPREKIRNFGKFLGGYITAMLIATIAILSMASCKNWPTSCPKNYDTADSTKIAQGYIDAIVNPKFVTVQDIIQFQQQTNENFTADSIFRVMSEQALINVATVIIKKQGSLTKNSLVDEYRANRSVYDNLPANSTTLTNVPQKVDLTATDLGNRRIISTSYSYRTDTIDGVARKIQIKKEESYVGE